ncbi:MAG: hypothetical protein PVI00_10955 [Desulfobacterales bacterium]|jgi:outer membrane biosynthesis protein TonB
MNLNTLKKTIRRKSDRRWTILFIGDHGNVITFKRFKAIIFAAGFLFLLAVVLLTVLFLSTQRTQHKHTELQNQLQLSQQRIETLRHEKEILMARLVLAESKAKEAIGQKRELKETPGDVKAGMPEPQKVAKAKSAPERREKPPAPAPSQPPSTESQSRAAESIMQVAIENFKVSRASGNTNVNARFKIKNTSRGYQRVAGNAVVLLKGADLNKNQWLVMPAVKFSGNKPSGKSGKRFSIQRFRTMNFNAKAPLHADQFQTAVVYVFTEKGELLLEQDFTIALPPLPAVSAQAPAGDALKRETQPAEASARQPTPPQEPPQKMPATPVTPGEDVVEALENAPPVF